MVGVGLLRRSQPQIPRRSAPRNDGLRQDRVWRGIRPRPMEWGAPLPQSLCGVFLERNRMARIQALTRDIGTNLIPSAGSTWKLKLLLDFKSDLFTFRTSNVFTNLSRTLSELRLMCASEIP